MQNYEEELQDYEAELEEMGDIDAIEFAADLHAITQRNAWAHINTQSAHLYALTGIKGLLIAHGTIMVLGMISHTRADGAILIGGFGLLLAILVCLAGYASNLFFADAAHRQGLIEGESERRGNAFRKVALAGACSSACLLLLFVLKAAAAA